MARVVNVETNNAMTMIKMDPIIMAFLALEAVLWAAC